MSRFQYHALLPLELRFLQLHPGCPEEPLIGSIIHQRFAPEENSRPDFEALSYCWGDQSQPDSIPLVNFSSSTDEEETLSFEKQGCLDIGRNLAAALRALRHTTEKRILWCDPICINQKDTAERAAQVQRMHDVYRYATRVIVWLGAEVPWGALVMDTLRWVGDQITGVRIDETTFNLLPLFAEKADKRFMDFTKPFPLSRDQWLAIEQVLDLDWHKRLWTYQEVALANPETCLVKLGREEMLWDQFKDVIMFLTCRAKLATNNIRDGASYVKNKNMFWIKASVGILGISDGWISVIRDASPYQCLDDRDRIFALRGLVSPALAMQVIPDYSKSLKEIFTGICLDHLTEKKNLKFLGSCNSATSPTLVPDLERPLNQLTTDGNACTTSLASACQVQPRVLEVAGILCDELVGDTVNIPRDDIHKATDEDFQNLIDMLQAIASEESLNDDEYLDKLIKMLTYGAVRDCNTQRLREPGIWSLHFLSDWRTRIRGWIKDGSEDSDNNSEESDTASEESILPSHEDQSVETEEEGEGGGTASSLSDQDQDEENSWDTSAAYVNCIVTGNTTTSCCKTRTGTYIRVPPDCQSGDKAAVLLGFDHVIILRPQAKSNTFTVVGPCYHPDFSHGQALLGADYKGWEMLWDRQLMMPAFYKEGEPLRRTDPRLDHVPLGDGFVERVHKSGLPLWGYPQAEGNRIFSTHDPRMSEAALKERGVLIQKLQLL
ncbi:heterokaryon incompatibility het-6 [Fusarium beomiforme]|uniref:Heterokaryon incompatibility het-6 n=1 Tax=Fusarium beomiforme TaxID=44412 RepID=A0A9P5DV80_9HYPO|nr:heterokaryon incompatibility het-6 [Fusarium beomiforme]